MYKLFIGFRKLGEFPTILEAKKYAQDSKLTGFFSLLGENYSDQAVEKLIQDLVDGINKEMPAFKKINRVIIRKRPFNVTTAMKIRRFVKDNREA